MGGLWWWVWAESAEQIVRTCAEVEVVTDSEAVARAQTWALEEVHLDAPDPNPLSGFRAERDAQRGRPGFGVLAGRERVYVRWQEDGDEEVFLMELGPDGRRLRQVEIGAGCDAVKTSAQDWPFNPPCDLYDPQYASLEISSDDFERAWHQAHRDPQG